MQNVALTKIYNDYSRNVTYVSYSQRLDLPREILGCFGRKMAAEAKLGCFTKWFEFVVFFLDISNLVSCQVTYYDIKLCYYFSVLVDKLPKLAQLNIISLPRCKYNLYEPTSAANIFLNAHKVCNA